MNPIDMLSAQEKENIIDYIQSYAGCDGGGCNVTTDIDYLLRYWPSPSKVWGLHDT